MPETYTYLLILLASIAGPLALSFDKKVAFYKKWRYVFGAMLLPAVLYIGWDVYFTHLGIWSFNSLYITGFKLINLPVEEVLFFFVVPYCCLFIYECIRCYFPQFIAMKWPAPFLLILATLLLITGFVFYNRYYTSWTFVFTAIFILVLHRGKKYWSGFDAGLFLIAYGITLIPFLIVNGFLTALPVVLYNDAENTGLRIYTIPAEDIFYGMLLVLMNVAIYEKLQPRHKQ